MKFIKTLGLIGVTLLVSARAGVCNPHQGYNQWQVRVPHAPSIRSVQGLLPQDQRHIPPPQTCQTRGDVNAQYSQRQHSYQSQSFVSPAVGRWDNRVIGYRTVCVPVTHPAVYGSRWVCGQFVRYVVSCQWTEMVSVQQPMVQRVWISTPNPHLFQQHPPEWQNQCLARSDW